MRALPITAVLWLLLVSALAAQRDLVRGVIRHQTTRAPIAGALVAWMGSAGSHELTGADGRFRMSPATGETRLVVLAIGFAPDTVDAGDRYVLEIELAPAPLTLEPLVVAANRAPPEIASTVLRLVDLSLRPHRSAQDLLQLAPGLAIAQHAGGGKAEQIFLRGFDADHGTDVAVSVDGVPVNLVSHAHGQGYADLHFLMPEVVSGIEVRKGGHDPRDGNLATAGAVALSTRDRFERASLTVRAASFAGSQVVGVLPFGRDASRSGGYIAVGGLVTDGPFEAPQGHRRLNAFGKWTAPLSGGAEAAMAASAYDGRWRASGQVPARAVAGGTIGRFGAIDPTEGGRTSRYDVWAGIRSRDASRRQWDLRAYVARYQLDLFSNFTFFLRDSVNGDGIEQIDQRVLGGLTASLTGQARPLGIPGRWSLGGAVRTDFADIALADQTGRIRRSVRVSSRLSEQNASAWARQELEMSNRIRLDLGLRADLFRFAVRDRPLEGILAPRGPEGRVWSGILSPKVAIHADAGTGFTLFGAASRSFHSNDARDVVLAGDSVTTLPRAVTIEAGLRRSWGGGTVAVSAWRTDLASELVYVGDEGTTEPSGRTRRAGLDLETRIRLTPWLWGDVDLSLVRGRLRDAPAGADRIPLAPTRIATGGLTVRDVGPITAGFRVRHVGRRPADETGAITAFGATLAELSASWRWRRVSLTATVDNLFGARWNEAQFATTSRLRGEVEPVSELHFTPGAPRTIAVGVDVGW